MAPQQRYSITDETILMCVRSLLEEEGRIGIRLHGSSMAPLVWTGATVEVLRSREVALGEIVLAQIGEELYCHRVVGREPNGWVLKGDGCDVVDGVVPEHAILGRVNGIVLGRWTVRLPRPVATWLRARIVMKALPRLRGAHRAAQALAGVAARRLGRSAIVLGMLATRVDIRRLSPVPRQELSQLLISWGMRPTQAALERWALRAEGSGGIALLASVGDRTRVVVALDDGADDGGDAVGRVDDGFVAGAFFATAASARLVTELVAAARERGLRTIRVRAAIDGPIREAFSRAGFATTSEGALVRAI